MNIVNFLLFVLGVIGMTHIIVDGAIFNKPREMLKKILPEKMYQILTCYQCCGFWCGVICALLILSLDPRFVFVAGCAGSFLAYWAAIYLEYLESKMLTGNYTDE